MLLLKAVRACVVTASDRSESSGGCGKISLYWNPRDLVGMCVAKGGGEGRVTRRLLYLEAVVMEGDVFWVERIDAALGRFLFGEL